MSLAADRPLGRYHVKIRTAAGERVLYNPLPKQDQLHGTRARNVCFGGAAGGAKSHGLRWHGFINCLRRPGLRVLLLRRKFTELEQTHLLQIPIELPPELGTKYNDSKHQLRFSNTSLFIFGHCQHEKDVRSYLSTEWDLILVDEASEFTPRMLQLLASRLRTTKSDIIPQMVLGTNPGGPAHLYILQRYIKKRVPKDEDPRGTYRAHDYEFISAKLEDNPHIAAEYESRLEALDDASYKAYRLGDWEAFAGQYFTEWDARGHHVVPVDEQFDIEEFWLTTGGMDWGYSPSPGILLVTAWDTYERGYTYREIQFKEMTPREVAEEIYQTCTLPNELEMEIAGDTQMWAKQPGSNGVSIADEINDRLSELGSKIVLVQANKNRLNGWMRLHQYLKPNRKQPDGSVGPMLRVFDHNPETGLGCPYLIDTVPAQVHDDKQTGDLKKGPTDHGVDAWRYDIIRRPPLSITPRHLRPETPHHTKVHRATRKTITERLAEHNRGLIVEEGMNVITGEAADEDGEAYASDVYG